MADVSGFLKTIVRY